MSSPSVLRPSRSIPIARASADDGSLPLSSTDGSSADERAGVEQHDVACRLAAWCCASPVRLRAVGSPETSKRQAIGKQASHQSKKLSCCKTPNAAGMQPHTHTHTHTLCVCARARDSRARASACVCVCVCEYMYIACKTSSISAHDVPHTSKTHARHTTHHTPSHYTTHTHTTRHACLPTALPTQMHYHGYMGSTGAAYIDYYMGDRVIVPPEHARHAFTEALVLLPESFLGPSHRLSPSSLFPPPTPSSLLPPPLPNPSALLALFATKFQDTDHTRLSRETPSVTVSVTV